MRAFPLLQTAPHEDAVGASHQMDLLDFLRPDLRGEHRFNLCRMQAFPQLLGRRTESRHMFEWETPALHSRLFGPSPPECIMITKLTEPGILNILTDVMLLVLPLSVLFKVQRPFWQYVILVLAAPLTVRADCPLQESSAGRPFQPRHLRDYHQHRPLGSESEEQNAAGQSVAVGQRRMLRRHRRRTYAGHICHPLPQEETGFRYLRQRSQLQRPKVRHRGRLLPLQGDGGQQIRRDYRVDGGYSAGTATDGTV